MTRLALQLDLTLHGTDQVLDDGQPQAGSAKLTAARLVDPVETLEDALAIRGRNSEPRVPHLVSTLEGVEGPFIAVSDYVKSLPDLVARWLPGRLVPLGTDGFGMSDTREELRRHFEVDADAIVIGALDALRQDGRLTGKDVAKAIRELDYDPDKVEPASI